MMRLVTNKRDLGRSAVRVRARVGSSLRAVLRARVDLRLVAPSCSIGVGELRRLLPLTPEHKQIKHLQIIPKEYNEKL